MQTLYRNTAKKSKKSSKSKWLIFSLFLCVFLTMSLIVITIYLDHLPSKKYEPRYDAVQDIGEGKLYPIIIEGRILNSKALSLKNEYLLPFSVMQEYIDPTLHLDKESGTVIFTSINEVITLNTKELVHEISGEVADLQFPIKEINGTTYVPYTPFQKMYSHRIKLYDDKVIEIIDDSKPTIVGEVKLPKEDVEEGNKFIRLRYDASKKTPYVGHLQHGDQLTIYNEIDGWVYVRSESGLIGYLPDQYVALHGLQNPPEQRQERNVHYTPWKPIGEKINLTWEHVISKNPDTDQISEMKGVNVVSPTWFHLDDDTGKVSNKADMEYVEWAHENGYQIWALFGNGFLPDRTHAVLSSYEKRRKVILQLLYYAEIYDLDGYNIDFENVYLKDKENLVQFVRELTPFLHEQGLVVSIDVTVKSTSEMWSKYFDREALGQIVDYMMVMTYDEHWSTSPKAGSVASLPWVRRGLEGILEEVPSQKVLLGVPFYTRLWKEERNDEGEIDVSSKAYSMKGIEEWIDEHNVQLSYDSNSGQMYGEYHDQENDTTYKVWLEDELSMQKRIELVHQYNLAGVASWRRGFEKPVIWDVIHRTLYKR